MSDIDRHLAPRPLPVQGRAQLDDLPHRARPPRRRHPRHPRRARTAAACSTPRRPRPSTRDDSLERLAGRPGTCAAARASRSEVRARLPRRPRRRAHHPRPFSQPPTCSNPSTPDSRERLHPRRGASPTPKDGGLAVLYGNIAAQRLRSSRPPASTSRSSTSTGKRLRGRVPGGRRRTASSASKVNEGDVVIIRYEGPKGGPGMQEMLYPTSYLKGLGPGQEVRADHRRPLLRRHVRTVDRTRIARSGGRRRHRAGTGRRPDRHRHTEPHDRRRAARRRTGPPPRGDRPLRTRRAQPSRQPGPEGLCVDGHVGRPGRSARRHLTKDHSTFGHPSAGHPRTTAVPDGSASGRTSDAVKTD